MPKYSPADAYKAKQDVARARGEFLAIQKEIEDGRKSAEEVRRVINSLHAQHKSLLASVEDNYLQAINSAKEEYRKMVAMKYDLLEDIKKSSFVLDQLQKEVVSTPVQTTVPLLSSIEKHLTESIVSMNARLESLSGTVDSTAKKCAELIDKKKEAEKEKNILEKNLQKTSAIVEEKKKELDDTITNLHNVHGALDELLEREKIVSIKEKRIDPEYQKIYFSQRKHVRVNTKKK